MSLFALIGARRREDPDFIAPSPIDDRVAAE